MKKTAFQDSFWGGISLLFVGGITVIGSGVSLFLAFGSAANAAPPPFAWGWLVMSMGLITLGVWIVIAGARTITITSAKNGVDPATLHALLGLVLKAPPTIETITAWAPKDKADAVKWAAREHVIANDHALPRTRKPACLAGFE